ncbi:MAG: hypothetical protein QJR08_03795 [Bacillota bacterium]|nr:hypothetical protein [Bacillota bacterium]
MRTCLLLAALLLLAGCGTTAARQPSAASEVAGGEAAHAVWSESEAVFEVRDARDIPADFWEHAYDEVSEPAPAPGVPITGSDAFTAVVKEAFDFLGRCDPKALAFVQQQVLAVWESDDPHPSINPQTWVATVSRAAAEDQPGEPHAVTVWYLAASLVHEAEHARQFRAGYQANDAQGQEALEMDAEHLALDMLLACQPMLPQDPTTQAWAQAGIDQSRDVAEGRVPCAGCESSR